MRPSTLALLFSLLLPLSTAAESMRCGRWVVDEEATLAELLQKCGEPMRKEQKTQEVYGRNINGASIRTGTSVTERWFYQRTSGSLPRRVTILDGKITHIETIK